MIISAEKEKHLARSRGTYPKSLRNTFSSCLSAGLIIAQGTESRLPSYDVRKEPWLPVLFRGGRPGRVGLRELFRWAHEIEDLQLPVAPAAAGVMRLLAGMAARIAKADGTALLNEVLAAGGPAEEWLEHRDRVLERGRFEQEDVEAYFDGRWQDDLDLDAWARRFDLFDAERPFLQDPRLVEACVDGKGEPNTSGINKLIFGRPTGINGAVLFGHFTDAAPVPVEPAEALWHMVAQLYFGPSGQCTPRRISPERTGSTDAGPLRKYVSYFPWAPDLFTTLVLAVPRPHEVDDDPELLQFPWETELPDPLSAGEQPNWPANQLTSGFRHSVLLIPEPDGSKVSDAYLTWATHLPSQAAVDPYLILDRRKDDALAPRQAESDRALWRDLDALLLQDDRSDASRPPALQELPSSQRGRLRVRAYGFVQDGQQKDDVWFQATTPTPVLQWQQEADGEMALRVAECHTSAEQVGSRLEYAAKVAWALATTPGADEKDKVKIDAKRPGPWAAAASGRYWPRAETVFWTLLSSEDPPLKPFIDLAVQMLEEAVGPATRADLQVARALSRARLILRGLARTSRTDEAASGSSSR